MINASNRVKRLHAGMAVMIASIFLTMVHLQACRDSKSAGGWKSAPNFSLTDDKDAKISLADFKGKVVLVNFWATWCHGCKQEIPWYMDFASKYRDSGLVVIGISLDDDGWKVVRPFVQEKKLNYPIGIGSQALAAEYGLDSMPLSVLVDRNGRIAYSHSGVVDRDGWEQDIQKLLQETPTLAAK